MCLKMGPYFGSHPCSISSGSGLSMRYATLVFIFFFVCNFLVSYDKPKRKFCNAVNSILSKGLGVLSEEVLLHIIKVKCLPVLLYGTKACVPTNRSLRSFDFYLVRFIMKIFRSNSKDYIHSILENMAFPLPSELFAVRLSITFTYEIVISIICYWFWPLTNLIMYHVIILFNAFFYLFSINIGWWIKLNI